jgi:transposase
MRKEPVVAKDSTARFVGLDVHAETISVAVAEPGRDGEVRSLGRIPNRPEAIRKLVKRLGEPASLRACYEAGPCGYVLYWQLTQFGVACEVVAPTLIPVKAGDRVKTDRKDAEKLARCYRAGELTAVWVPDEAHEALRDLVRGREAAQRDLTRARQRVLKLLLRRGRQQPEGMKNWTAGHWDWVGRQQFEYVALQRVYADYVHEAEHQRDRLKQLDDAIDEAVAAAPAATRAVIAALQSLRGVAQTTAVTVVTEVGRFSRFEKARELMGYSGAVPSERSSGGPGGTSRGSITKTGNAHMRRVLLESAWHYRHLPAVSKALRARQRGQEERVKDIAWKAQVRLSARYRRLVGRGKAPQKVATAIARELLGFMWDIGRRVEQLNETNQVEAA